MLDSKDLLDFKEASRWASEYLGKTVTTSNISYLVNYGRIEKTAGNGIALISKNALIQDKHR